MMYHINQKFIDEVANIEDSDFDKWASKLLNIIEEQEDWFTDSTSLNNKEQEEA